MSNLTNLYYDDYNKKKQENINFTDYLFNPVYYNRESECLPSDLAGFKDRNTGIFSNIDTENELRGQTRVLSKTNKYNPDTDKLKADKYVYNTQCDFSLQGKQTRNRKPGNKDINEKETLKYITSRLPYDSSQIVDDNIKYGFNTRHQVKEIYKKVNDSKLKKKIDNLQPEDYSCIFGGMNCSLFKPHFLNSFMVL